MEASEEVEAKRKMQDVEGGRQGGQVRSHEKVRKTI